MRATATVGPHPPECKAIRTSERKTKARVPKRRWSCCVKIRWEHFGSLYVQFKDLNSCCLNKLNIFAADQYNYKACVMFLTRLHTKFAGFGSKHGLEDSQAFHMEKWRRSNITLPADKVNILTKIPIVKSITFPCMYCGTISQPEPMSWTIL